MTKLYNLVRGLLRREPVRLAIVRRYADANGSYVGELYLERDFAGVKSYQMVGVSLDSLPLAWGAQDSANGHYRVADMLDCGNDFLRLPMLPNKVRVGAVDPTDNDDVRRMVARLPTRGMTLMVQNRFIERVLDGKPI